MTVAFFFVDLTFGIRKAIGRNNTSKTVLKRSLVGLGRAKTIILSSLPFPSLTDKSRYHTYYIEFGFCVHTTLNLHLNFNNTSGHFDCNKVYSHLVKFHKRDGILKIEPRTPAVWSVLEEPLYSHFISRSTWMQPTLASRVRFGIVKRIGWMHRFVYFIFIVYIKRWEYF